jgi:hypothetical protein
MLMVNNASGMDDGNVGDKAAAPSAQRMSPGKLAYQPGWSIEKAEKYHPAYSGCLYYYSKDRELTKPVITIKFVKYLPQQSGWEKIIFKINSKADCTPSLVKVLDKVCKEYGLDEEDVHFRSHMINLSNYQKNNFYLTDEIKEHKRVNLINEFFKKINSHIDIPCEIQEDILIEAQGK